jgi:hypothetical protein
MHRVTGVLKTIGIVAVAAFAAKAAGWCWLAQRATLKRCWY